MGCRTHTEMKCLLQGDDPLCCSSGDCGALVSRAHLGTRLQDLQHQVEVALELLSEDKRDPAIHLLLGCQQEAENFLTSEHMLMGQIEDHLAHAYASLGDWPKSAAHLRNSLRVVEAQHGPASVEMGHELFKLAQVLFNGFAVTEARSVIEKAEKVLCVHYGPENEQVQELQQMKACLSELPGLPVGPPRRGLGLSHLHAAHMQGESPQAPLHLQELLLAENEALNRVELGAKED